MKNKNLYFLETKLSAYICVPLRTMLLFALFLIATLVTTEVASGKPSVIVVVGAPGEAEYATQFHEWSERWRTASKAADADFHLIGEGRDEKSSDQDQLQKLLSEKQNDASEPMWLVLIGHG